MHTYVIAELGVSHDGSRDKWRAMIDAAVAAGVDAIKGQWWSDPQKMATHRKSGLEVYERYQMPLDWLDDIPMPWDRLCTVYLEQDVSTIRPLVSRFKVGSWESRTLPLAYLNLPRCELPIIVSTGGWSHTDLLYRQKHRRLRYLHCVSGYPTPLRHVNLDVIHEYRLDGFSDHTRDVEMGAFAVLAGANIVEAHLRAEDTEPDNPDFQVALPPSAFKDYVLRIRSVEGIRGEGRREVQPSESWIRAASGS